ncbi:hypothetical protein [Candidatus Nitrosopumilus sediminis]|uniref:Uncharacterized protein n=1 Tax=Candidatus Nitrosopumilus sediminis TaxID=1229909 RepID=K0B8W2_9ARCH|nr:hypothetical protein [Candidatus Nitrosopumilus sediminis]AFS82648.1 hypothetical protein NSED_04210 [Candidatus Nitrosopumilus sediminis]
MLDVKKEDISEESKKNHISYYKSLCRVISDIQKEREVEREPAIKNHLEKRIEAMEKDKKRIRDMFPDINEGEWDGYTN